MLPATDVDLSSDISAGISYVDGIRIQTEATAHTYTASKDTYVYIHSGGYFVYSEVSNGAAAPSTPSNTLLLAKVVTDADNITSVEDLRTLAITIAASTTNFPNHYRDKAYVSWDTSTTFHVGPGDVAIGTTVYSRTSDTDTKNISTATNWIEGAVPSGDDTIFIYAFNNAGSTYDFKFSSADPNQTDTSGNSGGVLRYYETGGVEYRAIGWIYVSSDAVNYYEHGNFREFGTYNKTSRTKDTLEAFTTTAYTGINGLRVRFYSSGNPVHILAGGHVDYSSGQGPIIGLQVDGAILQEELIR